MAYWELIDGWDLQIGDVTQSGQRVFIDTQPSSVSSQGVDLPDFGDEWSSDYPTLTVRGISKSLLPGCQNIYKYTVTYSNEDVLDSDEQANDTDLPVAVSIATEVIQYEPVAQISPGAGIIINNNCVFENSGERNLQPVTIRIPQITYNMYRRTSNITTFKNTMIEKVGKVNSETFYGIPAEQLLFQGAECEPYLNASGIRSWKIKLVFMQRIVQLNDTSAPGYTEGATGGWNHVIRQSDGKWDRVLIDGVNTIYSLTPFKPLLTSGYGIQAAATGSGTQVNT